MLNLVQRTAVVAQPPKLTDTGHISGYCATWTYQADGIRFVPGCFDRSIAERSGKIPLVTKHITQGGTIYETVGFVVSGENDNQGFHVEAVFLDTEAGQAARTLAAAGGVKFLSIGAKPITFERVNGIAVTTEAAIRDVVMTNDPADLEAEVTAAREADDAAKKKAAEEAEAKAKAEADEAARLSAEQAAANAESAKQAARVSDAATRRDAQLRLLEIRENPFAQG